MSNTENSQSGKPTKGHKNSQERAERSAQALRINLQRRKMQARERKAEERTVETKEAGSDR